MLHLMARKSQLHVVSLQWRFRFLIDTFGKEVLDHGSGVLDIAGGKGELSFELVNLNNIQATVVEPRPLQLWRQHKWMLVTPLAVAAGCCCWLLLLAASHIDTKASSCHI